MSLREVLKSQRSDLLAVAANHGARNVRLFGSVVRGEETEESDIDFLVDMEGGRSPLDLGGLQQDLEKVLRRRVDVLSARGLNPYLRERILREAEAL